METEVAFTKQRNLFPVWRITWCLLALVWETRRVLRSSVVLPLGARTFDRLLVCLEPIRHICLPVIGRRCRYERLQTSNNSNHIAATWWGKE